MESKTIVRNVQIIIVIALFTYFSWWKSLNVQVLYTNVFFVLPIALLFFNAFQWQGKGKIPLQLTSFSKKVGIYFVLIILGGVLWNFAWVGMSDGLYGIEDGEDFTAQDVTLANIGEVDLFQTDVIRKVPHNTGEIRLRANRFGWADVMDTDPLYEDGKLVWRAVIEPHGLINQLTKSAPAIAETSAEIESSPTVMEKDLKYSEAKLLTQFSMRRAWYANRMLLVDDGYITTDADGKYWWAYPRVAIKWFLFTYKKEFRGVTLVSAESDEIKHYGEDEMGELAGFLGKSNMRVYPESLALLQASIYGSNRFGWWAKQVTGRSGDGESLYEIPGGQLQAGAGWWQKYPFLTVYSDKLYWVTVYEPIGGEISGARVAAILLIGAEHSNAGEITMLKFDKLEKNLPGVNKILRFARAEVQNFEGWIPQQVQIYQDNGNLYALSSIVSGSGSGQRIMALAGVNLLGEEERAYVVKTSDYENLNSAHSALVARMFDGVEEIPSVSSPPLEEPGDASKQPVVESDIDDRLDEMDDKLDKIMEKLEIE
tara:strand:- start:8319 stop:9941 length:1623 start_codon:yes stop_codon:yes gene_type:complete